MFEESLKRMSERLPDSAKVLDVGGWARPLNRADWVLDLMPYDTRGMLGHDGDEKERFAPATWVQRDVCAREAWPFDDGFFDFVVCSHTLEDLRDPVWVCSEVQRVGRAGYIEVPSRLEEQSWNVQGPWVGWGHHHWLIDVEGEDIAFVFKPHLLGGLPGSAFPAGFAAGLGDRDRIQMLWWEGSFGYRERLFYEPEELNGYLTGFVADNLGRGRGHAAPQGPPTTTLKTGARELLRRVRAAARARSG
jgi:hypothetical protein